MAYRLLLFICLVALFWFNGQTILDPDFGWHIRVGDITQSSGIPKTDQFSYTMPGYPYVYHEWLTNVLMAFGYQLFGRLGLALIFALLATSALFIHIRKKDTAITIPLILGAITLLSFAGVRAQVVSWFIFSVLLYIISNKQIFAKWRLVLPLLFLLWVNLHGGFPIGLMVFTVTVVLTCWQEKRLKFDQIAILAASILVTFINPYGPRLWSGIWEIMSDHSLRWNISEWKPMLLVPSFTFWTLVPTSSFLLVWYRKKLSITEIAVFNLLLLSGLATSRHVPFFLIAALPLTLKTFSLLRAQAKKQKGALLRLRQAYVFFLIIVLIITATGLFFQSKSTQAMREDKFYPKQAIAFLQKNPSSGQTFSVYGWGGYLIWKLPEKKVFIDGRMASWKNPLAPASESSYAFLEYNKLNQAEISLKTIQSKYSLDTLLLPTVKADKKEEKSLLIILDELIKNLWFGQEKKKKFPDLMTQIKEDGWRKIYTDPVTTIYRQ